MDRARITIPNLLFWLMAMAFLGALAPVFFDALQAATSEVGQGTLLMYQLLFPVAILVLIGVIWRTATAGANR
jgi:hypothetical protein